jgi:hypothetical protein
LTSSRLMKIYNLGSLEFSLDFGIFLAHAAGRQA